jgi:transposase-like protein
LATTSPEEILAAYKEGESAFSIARRTGTPVSTVYGIVRKSPYYRDRYHSIRNEYIRNLFEIQELSCKQISLDLGCSQKRIYQQFTGRATFDPRLADELEEYYGWDKERILQGYTLRAHSSKPRPSTFTPEEQAEVYAKYESGVTVRQLCAEYNVKDGVIYDAISKARISAGLREADKPMYLSDALYPNIETWRVEQSMTVKEFAAATGVPAEYIRGSMYASSKKHHKLTKGMINKILETTGLPYEEAFEVEKAEGGRKWK